MKRLKQKRMGGRVLPLLLSVSLMVSACPVWGMAEEAGAVVEGVETAVGTESAETTGTAESTEITQTDAIPSVRDTDKSYTEAHLKFIDSEEYAEIMAQEGGLAAELAQIYEEANLNLINGIWSGIDSISSLAKSGSLDTTASDFIGVTNEYDIFVAYLMEETVDNEAYDATFTEAYVDAVITFFDRMSSMLKILEKSTGKLQGKEIEEAEELAKKIDDMLTDKLVPDWFRQSEPEYRIKDWEKLVQPLKEELDNFLGGYEDWAEDFTAVVGITADVSELIGASFSEMMNAFSIYTAALTAGEEWSSAWRQIAEYAGSSGDEEGAKLALSINTVLDHVDAALNEDLINTLFEDGLSEAEEQLFLYGTKEIAGSVNSVLKKTFPMYKAVTAGLSTGVTAANFLTNMDELAYSGQMMVQAGVTSECVQNALYDAEQRLRTEADHDAALYFDSVYEIFQTVQLAACDYAIDYKQAVMTAPLGYIFKYTTDDEAADVVYLQVLKTEIGQTCCHTVLTTEETARLLEKLGYHLATVTESEQQYIYLATTNESAETAFDMDVDAISGVVRLYVEDEWEFEFLSLLSYRDESATFSLLTEEEAKANAEETGYDSVTANTYGKNASLYSVYTYVLTYLDRTLQGDRVSGVAKVMFQTGEDIWGYVDLRRKVVLSGDALPEEETEAEAVYSEALTQEYVEEKLKELFGEDVFSEYTHFYETEEKLTWTNTDTMWFIEVNRLTGVVQYCNYRGVIMEEYQI